MESKYIPPRESLIGFMSNKAKLGGGINLAQGIPGFAPPERLTALLAEAAAGPNHQYAPGLGNPRLRQAILERYSKLMPVGEDNLLITNGATEALALIFHYLSQSEGRRFAAMSLAPVYESYRHLPRLHGHDFVEFDYDPAAGLDLGRLAATIDRRGVKLFFLGSPANPSGFVLPQAELRALLELCRGRGCYVVFDGVYRDLHFGAPVPFPVDELHENLFYVDSFSKIFSVTGWRVGFFFCHERHMAAIRDMHGYTGLCASSVAQEALSRYVGESDFGAGYVAGLRRRLAANHGLISGRLAAMGFDVPAAAGGYFVWARLPRGLDDGFRFAVDLYDDEQVAVVPGIHFAASGRDFVRVNIARDDSELADALARMERFVASRR